MRGDPYEDGGTHSERGVAAWRNVIQWFGSPVVAATIAAVSLPTSAYYVTQARSSALLVAELQAAVDAYTVARVGVALPSLVGYDLHGQRVSVDLSDGRTETLIFGVSGGCIHCLDILDVHRRLAEAAATAGRKVYWVSRDRLEDASASVYAQVAERDHLLVEPTNATYRALGLGFTPQTILVSADGVVKATWKGVTVDRSEMESEIRRALGVSQSTP